MAYENEAEIKADKAFSITIEDVRELADEALTGWEDIYQEAERDLEFYDAKNQWEDRDYRARIAAGRHAITVNRLPQFVHQVMNDIRQNTPVIKVLPADSKADPDTAEILQDLVRNIEYVSQADIAYDTGAEYAVKCSLGFIRIDHGYTAPDSFEQHVLIKSCPNPLAYVIDPSSIEPDGSDARYAFAFDTMLQSKFKAQWPNAKPESFDSKFISQNAPAFSCEDGYVTVAELFKLKVETVEIFQLENGEVVYADEYEKLPIKPAIVNTRTVERNQCMRYKVTGAEILEEGEFPSSYIPIIPVYGETHWIKGKRHLYSLIRNAKDTQRMYNYLKSLETEAIQKAPKAPYLAAEGQIKGYEDLWRNPDAANVLIYKTTDVNGTPVPPPQRVQPIPVNAGLVNASLAAIEDMKATMGMYNNSLGQQGNETSGKAIIARQRESDTATYHFSDNLSRSVTHVGRVSIDMIPRVVDTARILRVMGEDGVPRNVAVAPQGQEHLIQLNESIDRIYDISVGKYDVVVTTGPSYATKRVEAAEAMLQLTQSNPQIAQIAGDLLVEALDFPNAEALAKRLKRAVPPQFLDNEDEDATPDLRPQLQQAEQMMQAAADQIEQLQAQITQLEQEKMNDEQRAALDAAKLQLDAEKLQLEKYKLDIEAEKVNAEREKTQLDAETQRNSTLADLEKHKTETEANTKMAVIQSGNYVDPNFVQAQGDTGAALSAIAMALDGLGSAVQSIGQAQAEIAVGQQVIAQEISKPKKVVAKRQTDGTLTAELMQ